MTSEEPIRAIRFVRIGAVPQALLAELAANVSVRVSLPCRVAKAPGIEPTLLPGREQVDADQLLEGLEALPREPGIVVAGVTAMDMGSPIFSHFFGRSRRNGHALLVSLARLSPEFYGFPADPELTLHRAALEILHELGHLAGLGHCADYRCVMRFAPTVDQIDNRGATFCAACGSTVALPGVGGSVAR